MSSSTDSSTKMISLRSADGVVFEIEESVAVGSKVIKQMIEDKCADNVIPLSKITGKILALVVEYLEHHSGNTYNYEDLKLFDCEFMKVNQRYLYDLVMAANYLNIETLFEFSIQGIADMIKATPPEKLLKMFNIRKEWTPEEEEQVRRENAWAFM